MIGLLAEPVSSTAREAGHFIHSDQSQRFTAGDYVSSLHRARAVLARACPDMAPTIDVIVRAARELGATELLPTHRDMKPEHVLLDGSVPAFIDLDSVACADPVLDPALMLARFAALADVTSHVDRIGTAADALAAEHFARVPGDWRDRLAIYLASSLVEVADGLFHRQALRWSHRVRDLLARAAQAIATQQISSAFDYGRA
jgi:aminoglycoside phosphotransferase (APT) family kinase protein